MEMRGQILVPKVDSLIANALEVGDPTDGVDLMPKRKILNADMHHIPVAQPTDTASQQSLQSLPDYPGSLSFLISSPISLFTKKMVNFLTCTVQQPLHSDSTNFLNKEQCSEVLYPYAV